MRAPAGELIENGEASDVLDKQDSVDTVNGDSDKGNDPEKNEEKSEIEDSQEESNGLQGNKVSRSTLKYYIDLGLVFTFCTTFVTGTIKFSPLTNALGVNPRTLPTYEISLLHDYGALLMGFLILGHLLLNWKWITNMTKRKWKHVDKGRLATRFVIVLVVLLLLGVMARSPDIKRLLFFPDNAIVIDSVGQFEYNSKEIPTLRPDIFPPGHFSVFDILAHLDNKSKIDMDYHFDPDMNTHVIDSINGKGNWWYEAYYDGGWPEDNVFRMDHFPYKDGMYIRITRESKDHTDTIHNIFREEGQRRAQNNEKVVIPTVIIRGTEDELLFQNVEVVPHNLRWDTLQNGSITAIDVIMTLGDIGEIEYELQWYNSIGTAQVRNYFVEKINDDESKGRCGFVYEEGSYQFRGFRGNHIHIPSDIRVINSPEYLEFFWICI